MSARKLSILMYHQIGEFKNIQTLKANYCHYKKFSRQMAMLKLTGQTVIPMSEAISFLEGDGYYPDHCVAITFDDGYENFYQYAYPVLKKYNFSAMVYIVTGELSGKAHWLKEENHEPGRLMSSDQIKEIYDNGVEIGSHSVTHPRLALLTEERCLNELAESKQSLENLLNTEIDHICYPYGSCNTGVVSMARKAGYRTGTTTVKGLASPLHDALALPRKAVSINDSVFKVWKNLRNKPGNASDNIVINSIL